MPSRVFAPLQNNLNLGFLSLSPPVACFLAFFHRRVHRETNSGCSTVEESSFAISGDFEEKERERKKERKIDRYR